MCAILAPFVFRFISAYVLEVWNSDREKQARSRATGSAELRCLPALERLKNDLRPALAGTLQAAASALTIVVRRISSAIDEKASARIRAKKMPRAFAPAATGVNKQIAALARYLYLGLQPP